MDDDNSSISNHGQAKQANPPQYMMSSMLQSSTRSHISRHSDHGYSQRSDVSGASNIESLPRPLVHPSLHVVGNNLVGRKSSKVGNSSKSSSNVGVDGFSEVSATSSSKGTVVSNTATGSYGTSGVLQNVEFVTSESGGDSDIEGSAGGRRRGEGNGGNRHKHGSVGMGQAGRQHGMQKHRYGSLKPKL